MCTYSAELEFYLKLLLVNGELASTTKVDKQI